MQDENDEDRHKRCLGDGVPSKTFTPNHEKTEWNDWHWQIQNRIRSVDDLSVAFGKDLGDSVREAAKKFPMAITPYYASLIREFNNSDPVYMMSVPSFEEMNDPPYLVDDPLGEEEDSPVSGLVHRYKDRALVVSTSICSMYCRHSLSEDTPVTMSDLSSKKIQDVRIGDMVVTHTGDTKRVYDVFSRGYAKDVLIISTARHQHIETTQEHPFLAIKRKDILCNSGSRTICKPNRKQCLRRHPKRKTTFVPNFVEASELSVGDYVVVPQLRQRSERFCDENLAYLIGLYVAEGDIPKRKNGKPICVRLSFGFHETETLAKEVKMICDSMGKKVVVKPNKLVSGCTVRIYDQDLAMFLEEHAGLYSESKKLSESICLDSSARFRQRMLEGMNAGDGYLKHRQGMYKGIVSIEFNTASAALSEQIFMLLTSLGYAPSLYHSNPPKADKIINGRILKNLKPMHHVRVMDENGYAQWFGQPVCVTSKSGSFECNGYLFCRIKSIDRRKVKDNERFYDLSVEEDESYVASFLSVHNCTRKRVTGQHEHCSSRDELDGWVTYLKNHPEIKDAIVSGGDPFTMETSRLDEILTAIRSVESVEIIRIGTRTPVVLPMRIDAELVGMLRKHHPIWVNTHFNHPNEITQESQNALAMLADAGIPLGNQSVLLKGVNDDPLVIETLCRRLVKMRVRPYYLFQCDLVRGVEHFRTPVSVGLKIMEHLRGRISGIAIPTFVIDLPGGGGKVPLLPNYVLDGQVDGQDLVLRNYLNEEYTYRNPVG